MCRAQPVLWCPARAVRVDAILRAASGAQRLGVLASLPRYPGHADLAAGAGVSAADEPLWRILFTPITRTVWEEEKCIWVEVQKISRRVIRTLRRLEYLEAGIDDTVATGYDPLLDTEPELACTMATSVTQR